MIQPIDHEKTNGLKIENGFLQYPNLYEPNTFDNSAITSF